MNTSEQKNRIYYFIDVDVHERRIVGWGTEARDTVEVQLTAGYHRVFLSKGQYNKLTRQLDRK